MIYVFIIIIAICLLLFLTNKLSNKTFDTKLYKLGSGNEGSDFNKMGEFIQENCSNIESISYDFSDGGLNNVLKVNRGEYHFGICQERFLINAYNNILEFKEFEKLNNLRFISALNFETINFIVKDYDNDFGDQVTDNDIVINSFDDIGYNDKIIIGVGEEYSASQNNFEVICSDFGIKSINCTKNNDSNNNKNNVKCDSYEEYKDKRKVYYLNGTINELFNKFYKGEIHGIFIMSGTNNIYIENLTKLMNIKFIDFFNENSKIVTSFNNYFFKKSINTGEYFEEPQKQLIIPTLATRTVLFTSKDTPDNIVFNVTKCIYEKHFELQKTINNNISLTGTLFYEPIELAYCPEDLVIHQGAKEYFVSKNIISTEEKYEFDMDYYSKELYKNYWKYSEIGNKKFDYSFLLDKSEERNNLYEMDEICFSN